MALKLERLVPINTPRPKEQSTTIATLGVPAWLFGAPILRKDGRYSRDGEAERSENKQLVKEPHCACG